MTIALYAEFAPLPGNETTVVELITAFAEQVRREPGNLQFDPHHTDDDTVFVYELYRDQGAFEAHLRSDHGREFNRALSPLIVGGRSTLTMLAPIAAVPGPARSGS